MSSTPADAAPDASPFTRAQEANSTQPVRPRPALSFSSKDLTSGGLTAPVAATKAKLADALS